MPAFLLAQMPHDDIIVGYVLISLIYMVLVMLIWMASSHFDSRLILIGLVTVVASVGYATIVFGPGMAVAPAMSKLGVLLVLGGVAARLLDGDRRQERDVGSSELTDAFRRATRAPTGDAGESESRAEG